MTASKKTSARFLAGAALVGVCAIAATGCGNDVPPNAVAKVGDTTITKDEFNRWLDNAAKGQQQGGTAVVPDPPNFTKCVASLQKQPVPKGQKKPAAGDLKKQCKQQYDQLKADVMQFLIQAQWVQQEAEKQDVEVSDAEVKKSFEDQKKQAFPKPADYKKFLASSGMTEKDILYRVRLDQLQTKLTQKVTEGKNKVSDEDIEKYYEKNKKRFAQPERRDLLVILTKTKAKADQAKAALAGGDKLKRRREEVLDRRGLQEPGRQAARRVEGPAGEGARLGRVRRQEGPGPRAGQDAVRLLRLPGHEDHQGFPAVAEAGDRDDQEPAPQPA